MSSDDSENVPPKWKRIYITHVNSPSAIFVRDDALEYSWNSKVSMEIDKIMIENLNLKIKSNLSLTELIGNYVTLKVRNVLYRGLVLEANPEKCLVTCRLIDYGRIETVKFEALWPLPRKLRYISPHCVCLKLAEVIPTGSKDQNKWTMTAKDFLQRIFDNKKIYMTQMANVTEASDGLSKVPVDLFYFEKIDTDPFDPVEFTTVNIKDLLVHKGLAMFPRKQKEAVEIKDQSFDEDLSMVIAKSFSISQNEITLSSSFSTALNRDWLKPRMPNTSEAFEAEICFFDLEGQIYIHDDKAIGIVNSMSKILTEIHSKYAMSDDYLEWLPGNPLIAKYAIHNTWHRGLVLEVLSEGLLKVLFVDFGETIILDPRLNQCHKEICFEDVPIQSLRCKLENIVPNSERYPKDFISSIADEIIGERVRVQITRKNVKSFPLPVILHLMDELAMKDKGNLARFFVQKG